MSEHKCDNLRFLKLLLFLLFTVFLGGFQNTIKPAEKQVIIVGGNINYPPYEFIDEDGNPSGYNVELTRAIAEIMGFTVEFQLGDWRAVRNSLEEGKIDILQGMSYTSGRTDVVDFSIPHTVVHHAIYTRKGFPEISSLEGLRGKEVAFHDRGFIHNYLTENNIDVIPVLTGTPAGAISIVATGEADYAVVASLPAAYLINEMNISNVSPVGKTVISVKYCYAVKKGNMDLIASFNEGLAILKQTGQYDIIYDKWLTVLEPKQIQWGTIFKYGTIFLIVFLMIFYLILLWSWTLRKQVSLRTAALQKEIQERKRTMEELKLRQNQLIQADKMASLGVLVSGVAHEINNPNGLILLNTKLLLDYFSDTQPVLERYFNETGDFPVAGLSYSRLKNRIGVKIIDIQDSAKRIKRIVEDLKDFARRDESGQETVVDLNKVTSTAIRLLENRVMKSTRLFKTDYTENLPGILGNPQRIEQVIVNLIINACQALSASDQGIYIKTGFSREKNTVILAVRDEGEGIPPENISYVTDPFYTTKRNIGGTGLGLSVSAGIIKEHNGDIKFVSKPGKGTTVIITFPACAGIQ